ncbi:MAG: hypothetical protein FWE13_05805 [Firmicutes bacterium]|nr:hypothetical protein [Bacillota bacterium]
MKKTKLTRILVAVLMFAFIAMLTAATPAPNPHAEADVSYCHASTGAISHHMVDQDVMDNPFSVIQPSTQHAVMAVPNFPELPHFRRSGNFAPANWISDLMFDRLLMPEMVGPENTLVYQWNYYYQSNILEITLLPGTTFTDRTPLTALSIEELVNYSKNFPGTDMYRVWRGVSAEAIDYNRIYFHLYGISLYQFWHNMSMPAAGITRIHNLNTELSWSNVVGSGRFVIEWEHVNDSMMLTFNGNYWREEQGLPSSEIKLSASTLEVQVVNYRSTLISMVETGAVDMGYLSVVTWDELQRLRSVTWASDNFITMNSYNRELVRGLSYLIDGNISWHDLIPPFIWCPPFCMCCFLPPPPVLDILNIDRGAQIFAELGMTEREIKIVMPDNLEYRRFAENNLLPSLLPSLEALNASDGFNLQVNIDFIESWCSEWIRMNFMAGTIDIFIKNTDFSFGLEAYRHNFNSQGLGNINWFYNSNVDYLTNRLLIERDSDVKQAMFAELRERICNEAPVTFLTNRSSSVIWHDPWL